MAASTPVESAIGLHAAGGRLQRLDFLHVLGRRHACWKHSGARTPRRMDSFRTGSRASKINVLFCRHPIHGPQYAPVPTTAPPRDIVPETVSHTRVSCSGVSKRRKS